MWTEPPAASNGADAGHVEAEAGSNSGEAEGERNVNVQDEVAEGAGGDLPSPGRDPSFSLWVGKALT